MKFEEAKIGMEVIWNGSTKMKGTITIIDTQDKSVLVVSDDKFFKLWFFDDSKDPKFDLKTLKLYNSIQLTKKTPKFDVDLIDSKEFQSYLNSVSNKYEKELLPKGVYLTDVSIHENGKIVVKDNKGNKGISKCHHDDAFNIEVGLQLAIQRLAKKIPFVPKDGEFYYSILLSIEKPYKSTFYEYIFSDELNKAIGNCFRTEEEAEKNKGKIISRFKTLLKYAELIAKEDKG
jgi:hypothetical protein